MSKSTATRDGDGHPGLRIRNQEIRRVRIADILDNPANPRTHPDTQQQALAGAVAELGWYGYPDVFAHPDYPGQYMLSDGHLRRTWLAERYGQDAEIDVNVTDFTPEEAKLAIATKDPLAAMADYDMAKLDELLREVQVGSEAVAARLNELAQVSGILDQIPIDNKPIDEDAMGQTEHECPKCGFKW